jgi:hypothetical protein
MLEEKECRVCIIDGEVEQGWIVEDIKVVQQKYGGTITKT